MSPSRRRLLAGVGAVATSALAGCTEQAWSLVEEPTADQLSLLIKTPPEDDDPMASKIASQLAENLQAAGVDAVPEPTAEPELFREALMGHDFEVFVARHPGFRDPDALRSLLHSRLSSERGWQNPFGFNEPSVDETLEQQLTETGDRRRETVADLVEYLVETAVYTAVAFPDHVSAGNSSLPLSGTPRTPVDYASLLYRVSSSYRDGEAIRAATFSEKIADRLNPIAVDRDDVEIVLDLLYDPLVRDLEGEYVPWLAEDVSWIETDDGLEADVRLRDGTTWHDDTPLGPGDVEFTAEFLADTSLGENESAIPAPRYRGRRTAIADVSVDVSDANERVVRFTFGDVSEEAAWRALTIPILPEHVWEEHTDPLDDHRTEAVAWDNDEPVGSGLFAFVESESGERLDLELFDDHVILRDGVPDRAGLFDGTAALDRIEFRITPKPGAAVESLIDGDLDLIADWLPPSFLERLEGEADVTTLTAPTRSFYLIGFNTRENALSNYQFRQVVARLVDREYVVSEFFEGHATTARTTSELVGLTGGDDEGTTEFADFQGSQGEVDERWARSAFERAGFHYEDGSLII